MNSLNKAKKKKEPVKLWLSLGIIGVLLAAAYFYSKPPAALSMAATPETIALGEKIFNTNCASCHGVKGVGENPKKPGGGTKLTGGYYAPALNGSGHDWHHTNTVLFTKIKEGAKDPKSAMPGFQNKLSDEEITAVMHYFQSSWSPQILMQRAKK